MICWQRKGNGGRLRAEQCVCDQFANHVIQKTHRQIGCLPTKHACSVHRLVFCFVVLLEQYNAAAWSAYLAWSAAACCFRCCSASAFRLESEPYAYACLNLWTHLCQGHHRRRAGRAANCWRTTKPDSGRRRLANGVRSGSDSRDIVDSSLYSVKQAVVCIRLYKYNI